MPVSRRLPREITEHHPAPRAAPGNPGPAGHVLPAPLPEVHP
ncbi:hypothetical protein ACF1HJ_33750 [Streptomyces sp. NPDC013978]